MSFLGDLAAWLNLGVEVQKNHYLTSDSPFAVYISPPGEADYAISDIRFVVATEQVSYAYENQTEKPEESIIPIVRNVERQDVELKGAAYLYTITNVERISFSIHSMQFNDLAVPVDLARERWFHNEEREVQFLVASNIKISKIEIDYGGKTSVFVNDPGHRRLVCIETSSVKEKKSKRSI